MRDFAHQIVYMAICSFVFWVLQIVYSQYARTDFDAKYVKRRGSAQRCAFRGSLNKTLSFTTLFATKIAICETGNFRPKTPLTLDITGSAVALHCCKAHSKSIGKMENSTPCKIVTRENFILKLGIRDYVENITHYTNFHVHRFSGYFSTNR